MYGVRCMSCFLLDAFVEYDAIMQFNEAMPLKIFMF